jgi:hypothetical protein
VKSSKDCISHQLLLCLTLRKDSITARHWGWPTVLGCDIEEGQYRSLTVPGSDIVEGQCHGHVWLDTGSWLTASGYDIKEGQYQYQY